MTDKILTAMLGPAKAKGKPIWPHIQFSIDVTKNIKSGGFEDIEGKSYESKPKGYATTLFVPRKKPADLNGVKVIVTLRFITSLNIRNREFRAIVSELYGNPTANFMVDVDRMRREEDHARVGKPLGEIDFVRFYRKIMGYGKHKTNHESAYYLDWLEGKVTTPPDISKWGRQPIATSTPVTSSPTPVSPVAELEKKHVVESVEEPAPEKHKVGIRVEAGSIIFS